MPFVIAGIIAIGAMLEAASEEDRNNAQAYREETDKYNQYYQAERRRLDKEYRNYMNKYYR